MGVDTVGASPAEQKPFLVTADGSIQFEDMAGAAGSDWDYKDCFWAGRVRVVAVSIENTIPGPPAPPVPPGPPSPPSPPSPPVPPSASEPAVIASESAIATGATGSAPDDHDQPDQ